MKFMGIRKKKKKKGLFGKWLVVFIVGQVLLYTYLNMYLSYKVSIEISPTLTTCFFAFFGFEAGLLSHIKTTKLKKGNMNYEFDTSYSCSDGISNGSDNDFSDSVYQDENDQRTERDIDNGD